MQKEILILLGLTSILLIFIFLLYAQNINLRNDNQGIANAFFTNQNNLVEVCQIDYNAYIAERQKKYYNDLNALLNKGNYKVG